MNEVETVTDLAIRIMDSANESYDDNPSKQLLRWIRKSDYQMVLILDNCDSAIINSEEAQFHQYITKLLTSAKKLQMITTSQLDISFVSSELHHRSILYQLSLEHACELLGRLVRSYLTQSEKEEIAKLTGCVPLALQIVGAIFDAVDTAAPHVIIAQLKEDVLNVLSSTTHTAHTEMNSSIQLSYKYLNSEVKLIGQYLSYFPGSFDSDAACYIIQKVDSNWNCTRLDFLRILSKRSLLQYSELYHRDTYTFPILIKKFFKSVKTVTKRNIFWTSFTDYYSMQLEEVAAYSLGSINLFNTAFERNKHNFYKLLHMISCLDYNLLTLQHIVFAMHRLLQNEKLCNQIGNEALLKPITTLISKLEKQDTQQVNCQWFFGSVFYVEMYSTLVLKLYSLLHTGILETKFEYVKGLVERSNVSSTYKAYSAFVAELSQYYVKMGSHSAIARITTDLLQKMENCRPHECDYSRIGYNYFILGDYEKSIKYYETALKLQQLSSISIVEVLHFLYKGYKQIGKPIQAILVARNASALLQKMLVSNDFVSSTDHQRSQLAEYYQSMGDPIAARAVHIQPFKWLQLCFNFDIYFMWNDTLSLYYSGHYKAATELAIALQKVIKKSTDSFSFSCMAKFVQDCPVFEYACLQLLKGLSLYKSSNISKGLKVMDGAIQNLDVHGCTANEEFVKEACEILLINMVFHMRCIELWIYDRI